MVVYDCSSSISWQLLGAVERLTLSWPYWCSSEDFLHKNLNFTRTYIYYFTPAVLPTCRWCLSNVLTDQSQTHSTMTSPYWHVGSGPLWFWQLNIICRFPRNAFSNRNVERKSTYMQHSAFLWIILRLNTPRAIVLSICLQIQHFQLKLTGFQV